VSLSTLSGQEGRVALVTGAGVRVGAAIARRLARAGMGVAVHHHTSAAEAGALCEELRGEGGRAEPFGADLTDPAGVDAMVEAVGRTFGRLDHLVCSASIFEKVAFRELTREGWRRMQEVNCESQAFLVQRCLPLLDRSDHASVVLMVDIGGRIPWKGFLHYNVSKAGVDMLVRGLALELAPRIRVNGIAPGAVLYPDWYPEKLRARHTASIPLGRAGTAEDVAETAHFLLAGPDFVTGTIVNVDGGRSLGTA
jgi:pteridine reductase